MSRDPAGVSPAGDWQLNSTWGKSNLDQWVQAVFKATNFQLDGLWSLYKMFDVDVCEVTFCAFT